MRIGIVDYGVGNIGSVSRALEQLGAEVLLVTAPGDLLKADQLILPGVGNFGDCRAKLDRGGWTEPLLDAVREHERPFLGICVGMQLLATASSEGAQDGEEAEGLNLIPGRVESLRLLECTNRIPHVGWNAVRYREEDGAPLFAGIPAGTDFYFTHSYAFVPDDPAHGTGFAPYDIEVTAAVRAGHVWGTQFHPEKSSKAGFRVLRNFIESGAC